MIKKYGVEAAIIAGFLILALAAIVISTLRHGGEPDPPVALQPVRLHRPPPLTGLKIDPGHVPVSLDAASQGGLTIVLAGTTGPVSLPFRRDRSISFGGWAADGKDPASGVYLVIDGSKRLPTQYGDDRPDVAQALSAPGARQVGFEVNVPADVFAPGTHKLGLQVIDKAGTGYYTEIPQATIVLGN
jgi:hypothetical protein